MDDEQAAARFTLTARLPSGVSAAKLPQRTPLGFDPPLQVRASSSCEHESLLERCVHDMVPLCTDLDSAPTNNANDWSGRCQNAATQHPQDSSIPCYRVCGRHSAGGPRRQGASCAAEDFQQSARSCSSAPIHAAVPRESTCPGGTGLKSKATIAQALQRQRREAAIGN